jgi:hypothetical protein
VFDSRDRSLVFRFVAVYVVGYVVSVALLRLGVLWGIPVLLTAAVLAVPMGFLTYTLQRLLVFGGAK